VLFRSQDEQKAAFRPEPFLRLKMGEAQRLIDELWSVGLRPTEGTGSAGAMAAVQGHLLDLQRLLKLKPMEKGVTHEP